jgi:hypothetical protein
LSWAPFACISLLYAAAHYLNLLIQSSPSARIMAHAMARLPCHLYRIYAYTKGSDLYAPRSEVATIACKNDTCAARMMEWCCRPSTTFSLEKCLLVSKRLNILIDILIFHRISVSSSYIRDSVMRKILEACPSCGGALEIGEVHCTVCNTQVHARYRPCDFCALTEEQSTFLRLFVTSRGNLSEIEKRLGVSYPTVRAKLDEVIERLNRDEGASFAAQATRGQRRISAEARPPDLPPSEVEPPVPEADPPVGQDPPPSRQQAGAERRRILEAVKRGEMSAADGARRLQKLGDEDEDEA